MRSILPILALFSLTTATGQPYPQTYGREPARSGIVCHPSAAEATEGGWTDSRYLKPLIRWELRDHTFSTDFTVPFAWANRSVLLGVASASSGYEVRLNGKPVAYNANPNLPAEFDLSRSIREGLNSLEIVLSDPSPTAPLESWKGENTPLLGRTQVMSQPTMRIRDVSIRTWEADGNTRAEIGIVVKSGALNSKTSRIHYQLLTPANETLAVGYKDLTLDMRREDTVRFIAAIPKNLLWSAELPTQLTLRLHTQYEGRNMEYIELKPGFRTLEIREGNPVINGETVTLKVREVSPEIPANDMAVLKELGYNTLRPLPGIVPDSFFGLCDQMGLYAIVQAPIDSRDSGPSRARGGNPSNDPQWLPAYLERVEDSYHAFKFHPSVIAFALAEQSANGINLYESYLKLKRLETERPVIYPAADGEWNSDRLNTSATDVQP